MEELCATKIRDRDGNLHYSLVPTEGTAGNAKPLNGSLDYWVKQFLLKSTCVCNQVILRTHPAAASPLASIVDKENLEGVLGTIAGDNTLLIICRDEAAAQALHTLILSISGME
ncbi:arginine repressor, C-terminal domain protein [Mobiluncus curtisii ATCC 43063]|uniref:Arginine repressor n=1 Tax=Mobiluncus curtisii (strain ATCC 43063 / DSM 2711 / V125) TaxID=548479 RepID=D6ZHX0_MOBCV|nr:arginine repressor, C-terminal domain protein [Mobiluncus curtisii ATCC 43063]